MKYNILLRLFLVILLCWGCSNKPDKQDTKEEEEIKKEGQNEVSSIKNADSYYRLDSNKVIAFLAKRNDLHEFTTPIFDFYKKRDYLPIWIRDSEIVPAGRLLLTKLENAEEEGLNSAFYKSKELREKLQAAQAKNGASDSLMKALELMLTAEFIKYAADVNSGATRSERENLKFFLQTKSMDYTSMMEKIIDNKGEQDPYIALEPLHPEYHQLKLLLKQYREFAKKGGWPHLSGFKKLKLGDVSPYVIKLRERLSITGEVKTPPANFYNPKVFDQNLDEGVKTFQAEHGLKPDGIAGGVTLQAMNVSVEERIKQIVANMERWRLVPESFTDRFILVNVPEYRLYVYENNKVTFDMRVVVGEEFNATPIFNDTLKYIVFSPYWNIPKDIALKENLPEIYQDYSTLKRQGIEAVRLDGPTTATPVPFYSVPWRQYATDEHFKYFLRQKPGPKNPLGTVKFLFPNKHNIYFHDTPFGNLFESERRGYSHGCIRIEEPVRLADFLLHSNQQHWTKEQIDEAMHMDNELHIRIEKPIPVFILYFTTWVNKAGRPQFRKDVYEYDELLSELLKGNSIKALLEDKEMRKVEREKQLFEKRQAQIRERLQRDRELKEEKERQQMENEATQEQKPEENKKQPDSLEKNLLQRIFNFKK